MPSIPTELAEDARETLDLVLRLSLGPEAWAAVTRHLDDIDRGLAQGHADRVETAIGQLELFGEHRVATRVNEARQPPSPPAPAPAPVRDHLNRLIHDLDGRLGTDDGR